MFYILVTMSEDNIEVPIYRSVGSNSIRTIKITQKVYNFLIWLGSQYASSYNIYIGKNIIESDFTLLDVVRRNYIIDHKLRVYTLSWQYEPEHKALEVRETKTIKIEERTQDNTGYYGDSGGHSLSFNIPKLEQKQIWDHLKIMIDPLYDIKCKKEVTYADGVILCEACKEVWD